MRLGWTTDTVTTDVGRGLHYTLLWGLDGVVLREVGSGRVPSVNEGTLRRRLDADEVPVFAIDPGLFEGSLARRASWLNEIAVFDDVAAFCTRLGVDIVQVGALASGPEAYEVSAAAEAIRQLGDRAEAAGVHLAVRNEAGTAVATGAELAILLETVGHVAVRADWRPFDALQAGEDPESGLDALAPASVAMVTVRDATSDGAPAVPGRGQVEWERLLLDLAKAGWDELVNLEVHGRPGGAFGLHSASAVISAVRRAARAG